MRYIILLDEKDCSACGNDWSVRTEYKRHYKIIEVAQSKLKQNKRAKSAYLLSSYTQQMCEMSVIDFGKYVKKHGVRII